MSIRDGRSVLSTRSLRSNPRLLQNGEIERATPSPTLLRRETLLRVILALAFGVSAAFYCHAKLDEHTGPNPASDFGYHWVAGRAVLHGESPYRAIRPGGPEHFEAGYLYPLTTTVIAAPFVGLLRPAASAAVFVGFSVMLLVWGLTREGFGRLPMLGGIPVLWAVTAGQMSILATAGVLIPGLGWLAFLKPNLGLALAAYRPTRTMILGGLGLLALTLALQPGWPLEWLATVRGRAAANYGVPMFISGGPLILLALLRWRRPEARLLLIMACVPQSMLFYDQIALGLVPNTRNQSMLLVITGIVGYLAASWMLPAVQTTEAVSVVYGRAIVIGLYLPCVVMVLRRTNSGELRTIEDSD